MVAPRFPVFTHSRWFGALSLTGGLPLELREAHSGAQGLPAVQEAPVLRFLPERGTKMALPGLFHGGRAGRILQSPSLHLSLDPRLADLVHLAGPLLALLDQLHFQRRGGSVTVLRPRAARTWGAGCRACSKLSAAPRAPGPGGCWWADLGGFPELVSSAWYPVSMVPRPLLTREEQTPAQKRQDRAPEPGVCGSSYTWGSRSMTSNAASSILGASG